MIEILRAKKDDMNEVAKLHKKIFNSYFLSSFSISIIEGYYETYLDQDDLFFIARNNVNKKIVGFVMGYLSSSKARKIFISKYKYRLFINVFLNMMLLKKVVWKKIFSILNNKNSNSNYEKKQTNKYGDLLSIGILKTYRGKGISKDLLLHFENQLRKKNINKYYLSVYKDNMPANRFYKKIILKSTVQTKKYQIC